ncbi:MAG: hypothetical protein BRC55_10540 [Cyanobacteria bacterium SW_8_48_13]|nr:MAG: hypothetical protein BRC55_10540 [Cyanobacteria bacterium SW_8_48_13]
MIVVSALILFACSSLRHALFQSAAFDLGIFDQAIYLISQGEPPISSFINHHIMGDHAAWILYLLAPLYKIYPDVHWLFAIQAISLALGALPTWYLASQAGLTRKQATAMAVVYLLYPLVFNINLFDFHPEVMAIPPLLGAVLAARLHQLGWFCVAIIFVLGCKAVLTMTVAAMGFWLLIFEKRRIYGAIALFAGVAWFLIATQAVIPLFTEPERMTGIGRYDFLGDSVLEIGKNVFLKPELVLSKIFTLPNLEYWALLLSPVIWGLSLQHLTPLVGAVPTLFLNLLTDHQPQKDLTHQYSLPVLPFLLLAVISTLAAGGGWLRSRRAIVLWSLVAFLALAKFGYFGSIYLESINTWQATREAISHIQPQKSILTDNHLAPHVAHRPVVELIGSSSSLDQLTGFEYVLLNLRHPWSDSQEVAPELVNKLRHNPQFQLGYERDEVYLFERVNLPSPVRKPSP